MLNISVESNIAQVRRQLGAFQRDVDFAASRAINDAAFAVRDGFKEEMQRVFDRPTRFTLNAFQVRPSKIGFRSGDRASAQSSGVSSLTLSGLNAMVVTKDHQNQSLIGQHYLAPQVNGGRRGFTKLERLLQFRLATDQLVQWVAPAPGAKLDKHGNWSVGERNKALAFLRSNNDFAQNRRPTERTKSGKRKRSNRIRYFVPDKESRLSPGIYKVRGKGQPTKILHFLRTAPNYSPIFQVERIANEVIARDFERFFDQRIAQAIATSRDVRRLNQVVRSVA